MKTRLAAKARRSPSVPRLQQHRSLWLVEISRVFKRELPIRPLKCALPVVPP